MTNREKLRHYLETCSAYHSQQAQDWRKAADAVAKVRPTAAGLFEKGADDHLNAASQFETALMLLAAKDR